MDSVLFWDFDGTLAYREGMWGGCMVETLDVGEPRHCVTADDLRPFLAAGFPWHTHDMPHPELAEAAAWWRSVEAVMSRAYEGVGFEPARARELAREAHLRYIDCSVGWSLFNDTLDVLGVLREEGWRHVVLSNHVPELPTLVEGLGLAQLVDLVFTSAVTGYEKPHPKAFEQALERCGQPVNVWMIGDNPVADIAGAEAAGIRAILVRAAAERGGVVRTLADAQAIILADSRRGRKVASARPNLT